MSQTLVGIYSSMDTARQVVETLVNAGFERSNITIDPRTESAVAPAMTTSSPAGQGGIGGFVERLFGFNIPENDANLYAESVRRGNHAVAITISDDDAAAVQAILSDYDPVDIDQQEAYYRSTGYTTFDKSLPMFTEQDMTDERTKYQTYAKTNTDAATHTLDAGDHERLEVVEEALEVGKRQVQGGGVRIRSYVTERPVEASVTLREERVTVERHPVDRPATASDLNTFEEGVIEMTEMREEAVISKTARVIEEVVVGKEATEHTETVHDTVRRKDVEVEHIDSATTTDTSTPSTDYNKG